MSWTMVTMVKNTVLHIRKLLRVDLKNSYQKKNKFCSCVVMGVT